MIKLLFNIILDLFQNKTTEQLILEDKLSNIIKNNQYILDEWISKNPQNGLMSINKYDNIFFKVKNEDQTIYLVIVDFGVWFSCCNESLEIIMNGKEYKANDLITPKIRIMMNVLKRKTLYKNAIRENLKMIYSRKELSIQLLK